MTLLRYWSLLVTSGSRAELILSLKKPLFRKRERRNASLFCQAEFLRELSSPTGHDTTVSRALCLLLRRPSRSVSDAAFLPVASSESYPANLSLFFKVHTHGLLWRPGAGWGLEPSPAQLLPGRVQHWAKTHLQKPSCTTPVSLISQ